IANADRRSSSNSCSLIALAESLREALPPARIPELPAELALRLLVRGTLRLGHHERCHLTARQPPQPAWDAPWSAPARAGRRTGSPRSFAPRSAAPPRRGRPPRDGPSPRYAAGWS